LEASVVCDGKMTMRSSSRVDPDTVNKSVSYNPKCLISV